MWSLFVEDNWTPIDPLTITFGIRYDDHNMFGGHVSPRAYAVYDLTPNWVLKGGISTGYKPPQTTDLFDGITGFGGQGTSPFVGNPDLQPETSFNSEIALYWSSPTDNHNFNITYFRNDFEDKIANGTATQSCELTGGVRPCVNLGAWGDLGYVTYNQKINVNEVEINGVEVAGRYQIIEPLSIRANYTWTDSEQLTGPSAGQPLQQTAKHMANATLDWQPTENFSSQLIVESRSDRYRGAVSYTQLDVYKRQLPRRIYPPLFNRYAEGQTFGFHVDNAVRFDRSKEATELVRTDVSATLFLASPDEYDGGELIIEDTYGTQSVKLPAGHLVLYPSTSLHKVPHVTSGARLAAFRWNQSMVRDDSVRPLMFDLDVAIRRSTQDPHNNPAPSDVTAVLHHVYRQWASPSSQS